MSVLHTVNKSPFERNTAASCLRLAKLGSAILFIEDGVTAALKETKFAQKIIVADNRFKFYVLVSDLIARGFDESNIITGVTAVDYGGFVDLVAEYDSVHAWL